MKSDCYSMRHSFNFRSLIPFFKAIRIDSLKCGVVEKRAFLSTSAQILATVSEVDI